MLFIFMAVMLYPLIGLLPARSSRWRRLKLRRIVKRSVLPPWMLALFLLRNPAALAERDQLLLSAGLSMQVLHYELGRRTIAVFLAALGVIGFAALSHPTGIRLPFHPVHLLAVFVGGLIPVCFDKTILKAVRRSRTQRMIGEIFALSSQLLYYSSSRMNLHSKLSRCLPHTRAIRKDLQIMLNEWYQDAEEAIDRFKRKLGTDEAYSFAETLRSLRLNETEDYYGLLKERNRDYKDKIDLARDSKKETISYALFVIAGLPILNTFRIFVYPWVMEGQKLFQSLS
jgi:hypothetical protein